MTLIIDIVLLAIIALCTWGGYKRGLVGGIAGLFAIVIALFGGSLLSATYSGEVIPALRPFVGGLIDSQQTTDAILKEMGYGDSDKSLNDILADDSSLSTKYAASCMRYVGFSEERSDELAVRCRDVLKANPDMTATEAVIEVLCDTITYVLGLLLAFLLILIALVAIANVFNLSFRLPTMENLDEIGGAVLGFARGFLYCILLSWILSFLGVVIGRDTLEETLLAQFFMKIDFVTRGLLY
ncbi:MAG: CvpA family protein [Oscillospiraceae bacterium]|nr:CvpA family protein [Oscillospiraceae bacterium]